MNTDSVRSVFAQHSDLYSMTIFALKHLQVKQRLEELQRQEGTSDVVVVGGGYAGIELASVAAEMLAGNYTSSLHARCASCALQQGARGCAGCCCKLTSLMSQMPVRQASSRPPLLVHVV